MTQREVDVLSTEYEAYISKLRADWLRANQVSSESLYELMRPNEREQVHQCISQWVLYITPFAEAWWKERGFGVVWPESDSESMQVYELQAA